MKPVPALRTLEQHMRWGNEQQRIDALFDALEYGDAGLDLMIQALDDPSQSVREAAHLLLTENQSERAKQALWNYLPYRHLQSFCTLYFLEPVDEAEYRNWQWCGAAEDPEPEKMPVIYNCSSWLDYVAFIPNRDLLVTYSDEKNITYLWNYRTGEMKDEIGVASWEDGGHVVLSPGGTYLIHNHQIILYGRLLQDESQSWWRDYGHPTRTREGCMVLEWEPNALAVKSDYTLIAGVRGASYDTESICVYRIPRHPKEFSGNYVAQQDILHLLR